MIEFIDKPSEQTGTPINRQNMMALQGFVAKTVVQSEAGVFVETNSSGHTLTTVFEPDKITQTFSGEYTITKVIRFINTSQISYTQEELQ